MKKGLLLLLVFLTVCFFGVGKAQAHATPITYEPEAASIVEITPERVRIHFSERIEQGASGISVYAPDGARVDHNDATVDSSDAHFYVTTLRGAGEGTYTVSWQVVSADDGHFTKGAFSFSVGKVSSISGAAGGQIQIQHITTVPQAATIGIELIGQAILLGALLLLAFVWRPLRRQFGNDFERASFEKKFILLISVGVAFIIVGVASFLIIKTFDLQQLRFGTFPEIFKIFLGTVDGSWALARGILGAVFLALFLVGKKRIFSSEKVSFFEFALWAVIVLVLIDRARVSHAAASHFLPAFSIFINAAHLFFKELWVGGLLAVATLLLPVFVKTKNALAQSITLTSFSKIVSIVFGGAGITGVYIIWLHLKDPRYIFTTEWGSRFIILTLFAVILFAARLWHQLIIEKSAVALCEGKSNNKKELLVRWTRYSLPFEALLGVALLFITSFIIITTPPYPPAGFTFERQAVNQGVELSLTIHPYEQDKFLITASETQTGNEAPLSDIVITLTNEEKSIGSIVAATEKRFAGGYVFPRALFSPTGEWKIGVSARRPGVYDAVASFLVDYPREVETTRINPDSRTFGAFEILNIFAVFGILALAVILFYFSKKLNAVCVNLVQENSIAGPTPVQGVGVGALRSWCAACLGLVAVSSFVFIVYEHHLKSDFQKLCERNGHFWFQSAPVRDGQALSSDTVTGCFLDVGLYHFADEREYRYFLEKQEVLVEVTSTPETLTAGVPVDFIVSLSEVQDGRKIGPAHDIGTYHDRILHVQIVGEDLQTFAHVHPEDIGSVTGDMKKDARFPFRYTFPKAGEYALNIDYVASGREQSERFRVNIQGDRKMERRQGLHTEALQTKEFAVYEVIFTTPKTIKAGERIQLRYDIKKNGQPVKNLEPYLAAAMHIALIREDFGQFTHAHGEASQPGSVWFQQIFGKYFKYHIHFAPEQFGPTVITQPWTTVFPSPGIYQVFGEFKHEGKIIVTYFAVEVE